MLSLSSFCDYRKSTMQELVGYGQSLSVTEVITKMHLNMDIWFSFVVKHYCKSFRCCKRKKECSRNVAYISFHRIVVLNFVVKISLLCTSSSVVIIMRSFQVWWKWVLNRVSTKRWCILLMKIKISWSLVIAISWYNGCRTCLTKEGKSF